MAKAKCNYDCFNCAYDDCIASDKDITTVERMEISHRDKRYFNDTGIRAIHRKPKKARICKGLNYK